jgi:hypothetical protein
LLTAILAAGPADPASERPTLSLSRAAGGAGARVVVVGHG